MAAGSLAMPALLVALLACATARVAAVAGGTACVGAICGMGACTEVSIPFTAYECECYSGWSWPNVTMPVSLPPHLFMPCAVPTCLSIPEFTCYRPKPPNADNASILDPCSYNDCGSEGTCVREVPPQFRCQCNPGAANVKGDPSMPCIKNCAIDDNGCPVSVPTTPPPPPPPPPPPSSSTAPPGNDHESSGPTAPSSTKGSVSLRNRLRLSLLLASLAALHIVIM